MMSSEEKSRSLSRAFPALQPQVRPPREPGSRVYLYHFAMLFWGLGRMVFDSSPAGANYLVLYTRVLSRDVPANAILSKKS